MSFTQQAYDPLKPRPLQLVTDAGLIEWTWYGWFRSLVTRLNQNQTALTAVLSPGITVTIVTAKLTVGGANGSMTFTNGILTAQTPAT